MTKALVQLCVDHINAPSKVQVFNEKGYDVDSRIRKGFLDIMGTETPTMKDVRRNKIAIFEVLEEVLTETYIRGVEEDEFFMQFAEFRNLALGDEQSFYLEDDSILTVSEHAGNHWTMTRQKLEGGTDFVVKTKAYAVAVYGDFFLFATGRLSFSKLVEKVAQAVQKRIYQEVAGAFADAVTKLPSQFTAQGSYDEEKLQEIVAHVEAHSGAKAIVIGTAKGLRQVQKGVAVQYYSDSMKNELAQSGRISHVNGLTLVQLPNVHKANSFDFAYDDNQLLIVPLNDDKFIKVVFEGEDFMKEVTDEKTNNDMSSEYKFMTHFGVRSVFNRLIGTYTLS